MDYSKLISEKWNLTAKFNCLQAIYFDAPSALAVPMCGFYSLFHSFIVKKKAQLSARRVTTATLTMIKLKLKDTVIVTLALPAQPPHTHSVSLTLHCHSL